MAKGTGRFGIVQGKGRQVHASVRSLLVVVFSLLVPLACAPDGKDPPVPAAPSPTPPGGADMGYQPDPNPPGTTDPSQQTPQQTDPAATAALDSNIPTDNRESARRVRVFNAPRGGIAITVESLFGTQVRTLRGLTPGGIQELACGLGGCVLRAYRVEGGRRVDDKEFSSDPFAPGTCVTIEPAADFISFRTTGCEFR